MATKIKRLTLHLRTFLLLIGGLPSGDGYSCPYGQQCGFEPAPPGRAPSCAQPGLTYCVHPDPYPESIIRQLVDAGQYDFRTLLSDETRDDFNSHKKPEYPYGYGPNSLPNVDQISLVNDPLYPKNYNTKYHTRYNHDIFSHKTPLQPPSPVDPAPYNVNVRHSSNFTKFGFQGFQASQNPYWNPNHFHGYDKVYRPPGTPNLGYNPNFFDAPVYNTNFDTTEWTDPNPTTTYDPRDWWKYPSGTSQDVFVERSHSMGRKKRNAELVKAAAQRQLTGAEALRIALGLASAETSAERTRRQATNTQDLCQSRVDFIQPRAALNNQGSWRYVVNMPNNTTQLVRVEICTSQTCNGICSLPNGYSSRCEQKYIQKRLVALNTSGQNLYTDVFWIPSCCQCTIVNNNV